MLSHRGFCWMKEMKICLLWFFHTLKKLRTLQKLYLTRAVLFCLFVLRFALVLNSVTGIIQIPPVSFLGQMRERIELLLFHIRWTGYADAVGIFVCYPSGRFYFWKTSLYYLFSVVTFMIQVYQLSRQYDCCVFCFVYSTETLHAKTPESRSSILRFNSGILWRSVW